MQPKLIVGHDHRRTDKPNARSLFLNKNLPSCVLFAERNLSIRANDLDAGFASYGVHLISVLAARSRRPPAQ